MDRRDNQYSSIAEKAALYAAGAAAAYKQQYEDYMAQQGYNSGDYSRYSDVDYNMYNAAQQNTRGGNWDGDFPGNSYGNGKLVISLDWDLIIRCISVHQKYW